MIDPKTILEGKVAVYLSDIENNKDGVAAKLLLETTAELLESKKTMPYELQDWLAQGIRHLLQGSSTTKAFSLPSKSKKKTRNLTKQEFEREAGEFMSMHPGGKHKGVNKNGTTGALIAASEKYGIGENEAGKISQRYDALIEEELIINDKLKQENEPNQ